MPGAFWSVDLDIYTISMRHDLRVSLLAAIINTMDKNFKLSQVIYKLELKRKQVESTH